MTVVVAGEGDRRVAAGRGQGRDGGRSDPRQVGRQHHDVGRTCGQRGEAGGERGDRTAPGRVFAHHDDPGRHIARWAHHDNGVGVCHCGQGDVEQPSSADPLLGLVSAQACRRTPGKNDGPQRPAARGVRGEAVGGWWCSIDVPQVAPLGRHRL